jgi:hypothetical protein
MLFDLSAHPSLLCARLCCLLSGGIHLVSSGVDFAALGIYRAPSVVIISSGYAASHALALERCLLTIIYLEG